eukprot:2413454-Rhodomonas_salina.1
MLTPGRSCAGEIDCVDSSGRLAEIKSKPAWAKENQSYDRVASNWIQAKLIGVEVWISSVTCHSGCDYVYHSDTCKIVSKFTCVACDGASDTEADQAICLQTMATGAFTAQRGVRDGPVTFTASNIVYQSLEQYGTRVSQRDKEAAFEAASAVITQLQA